MVKDNPGEDERDTEKHNGRQAGRWQSTAHRSDNDPTKGSTGIK